MNTPYETKKCECCGQTTEVLYPLDKGSVDIVRAMAVGIRNKGINVIHPHKELSVGKKEFSRERMLRDGSMTFTMLNNMIRPHKHGLIAKVKKFRGEPVGRGNWCLTDKGIAFLKGQAVPKFVIQSKKSKVNVGYLELPVVTINELIRGDKEYWEGIDYEISEGNVVKNKQEPQGALL